MKDNEALTMNYAVGDTVWIPDQAEAFVLGQIASIKDNEGDNDNSHKSDEIGLYVKCLDNHNKFSNGDSIFISKTDLLVNTQSMYYKKLDVCGNHLQLNVTNLVQLEELSEGSILYHLRKRFYNNQIYTFVGSILVSINPFQQLDIYNTNEINEALQVNTREDPTSRPHVFATAAMAYNQMKLNNRNQSILVTGESGAGKTETVKKVLKFISTVASSDTQSHMKNYVPSSPPSSSSTHQNIEEMLLQSNPLLESLGNAKTLRNNNSSRFGKWMKINFDRLNFKIQGKCLGR
jgi:myosin heavy subunit